jgi:hypothetical protein
VNCRAALTFERPLCDLGRLVQGESRSCEFSFANPGPEEVVIHDVEPSCGCTTALLTAALVPPGARGAILATFDSSAFVGEVTKEITVRSSDPANPSVTLSLRARVEPEIAFEPRQVTFDDARPGVVQEQTVVLTNLLDTPVELRAMESAPSSFDCRVPLWQDPTHALVIESRDRISVAIRLAPPPTFSLPVGGECALTISGARLAVFRVKLLALPGR